MTELMTGDTLKITGNEVEFHNFEEGAEVEFLREHDGPVFGYLVRGINKAGLEITQKVLDEHIEK